MGISSLVGSGQESLRSRTSFILRPISTGRTRYVDRVMSALHHDNVMSGLNCALHRDNVMSGLNCALHRDSAILIALALFLGPHYM